MDSKPPKLTTLKQYLKVRSQAELIEDIAELFKKIPAVKDYYQLKLDPQSEDQVIEKYKKVIQDEFFPARGFGKARLSVARKAVNDYQKIAMSTTSIADIMLFYVEQGVKFTTEYGDIDEPFYNSMESMYNKVLEWITKYNLQDIFQPRCRRIVTDTSGMGWGFHDALAEIYHEVF
ncbi:MAG: DUF6155 family protein [Cyanobacteria bacterium P01_F01_bin.86]